MFEAMAQAGHTKPETTLGYMLLDVSRREKAALDIQQRQWRTQLVEIAKGQRLHFRNGLERDEAGGRVRKERAGPACLQGEVGRRNAQLTAAALLGCRLYYGNGRPQLGNWDRVDYPRSAVTKLASDPAALLLAVHYSVRWFFIDGIA